MNYGAILYDSDKQTILKSLKSVFGLRLALGAFKSTQVNSILAESEESPLRIRMKLSMSHATKALSNTDNSV